MGATSADAVLTAGPAGGRLWGRPLASVLAHAPASAASARGPEAFVAVAVAADGSHAAVLSAKRTLWLLYLQANRFAPLSLGDVGATPTEALCFSHRYCELLVGAGCYVAVVDVLSRQVVQRLRGHAHKVTSVDCNALRGMALSLSKELCVVWDSSRWEKLYSLPAGSSSPLSTARLGRGHKELVATLAADGRVQLWSAADLAAAARCPPRPLCAPDVDGRARRVRHVALGSNCVLAAAEAQGRGPREALLLRWHCSRPEQPPAVVEVPFSVKGLLVREHWVCGEAREVAVVLHAHGAELLDLCSWRPLASVEVAAGPEGAFDAWVVDGGCDWSFACVDASGLLQVRVLDAKSPRNAERLLLGEASLQVVSPERLRMRKEPASLKPGPASRSGAHTDSPDSDASKAESDLAAALAAQRLAGASLGSAPTAEELVAFLGRRGAFPNHLRPVAWRILLSLPGNVDAHEALASRGEHPAFAQLDDAFPLPALERRRLCSVLSALAFWAPELADLTYLPALVFPVVQVFGADEVSAFEFAVLFFRSWGRCWLDFLPLPPIGELDCAADLLEAADPELLAHLASCSEAPAADHVPGLAEAGGTPALAAIWPLLQTILSEALPRATWLALWDHLVARWREPSLLGACALALLRRRRRALLALPPGRPARLDAALRRPAVAARAGPAAAIVKEADALLALQPPAGSAARPSMAGAGRAAPPTKLPRGLAYPPLVLPARALDCANAELERLEAQEPVALVMAGAGELAARIQEGRLRLAELELRVVERAESLARDRQAHSAYAHEQADQLAVLRSQVRHEALLAAQQRRERSERDLQSAVQHQQDLLQVARQDFANQLDRRRVRREELLREALEEQAKLGLEQRAAMRLVDAVQRQSEELAASQLERQVELWRRERSSLDESLQRAAGVSKELHLSQQRAWRAGSTEVQRLEALAQSERMARTDLELEALQRDLRMGRFSA